MHALPSAKRVHSWVVWNQSRVRLNSCCFWVFDFAAKQAKAPDGRISRQRVFAANRSPSECHRAFPEGETDREKAELFWVPVASLVWFTYLKDPTTHTQYSAYADQARLLLGLSHQKDHIEEMGVCEARWFVV